MAPARRLVRHDSRRLAVRRRGGLGAVCYSVAGRIQTRLAALSVPALLALLLVWLAGDQRYLTMVIIMALVVLDLDLAVYPRLLDYQSRWQTYLLGLGEFALTLGIVRWLA